MVSVRTSVHTFVRPENKNTKTKHATTLQGLGGSLNSPDLFSPNLPSPEIWRSGHKHSHPPFGYAPGFSAMFYAEKVRYKELNRLLLFAGTSDGFINLD